MSAESSLEHVRLAIVGEFWEGLAETQALIKDEGLADRVELVPRYVSDQDAAEYFARCDAVIAPYRSATGSGVVALAQYYGRPVIASDVPGLSDAVNNGETGWLFPSEDVRALAQTIEDRVSRGSAEAMHSALAAVRDELSWSRLADAVISDEPSAFPIVTQ